MARPSPELAVFLAFVAAVLSLMAAAISYYKTGDIDVTPLAGGLFMLALGVGGFMRLKNTRP
jgi:hypothetical protein